MKDEKTIFKEVYSYKTEIKSITEILEGFYDGKGLKQYMDDQIELFKKSKTELQSHITDLIFALRHLEATYNENPENQDSIDSIDLNIDSAMGRVRNFLHRTRLKNNAIKKLKEM